MPAHSELLCDYGYLDNYVQLEKLANTIMTVGKILNKNDVKMFQKNMKESIQQIRKFAKDYKGYFNVAYSIISLIGGKLKQ